ncbi:MAG: phosphoribosylanthranilate isomerase, partial [Eggerthellaceae bacterium]|nr:phosphoribosylanthranilate isomerase [Eggerthellaceae bacterium]
AYISELRHHTGGGTIQAFQVGNEEDASRAEGSAADMVLLDNGQGTGAAFDWSYVSRMHRPFILAGGLTPENVGEALDEVRPWGVDMSSGLETDKLKDPEKIAAAVREVRRWRL